MQKATKYEIEKSARYEAETSGNLTFWQHSKYIVLVLTFGIFASIVVLMTGGAIIFHFETNSIAVAISDSTISPSLSPVHIRSTGQPTISFPVIRPSVGPTPSLSPVHIRSTGQPTISIPVIRPSVGPTLNPSKHFVSSNSPSVSTAIQSFTFKASNQDALEYFGTGCTPTYQILKDYIGVIEPSKMMEVHFFEEVSTTYEFSVCPDAGGDCQTGMVSATSSDTLSISCTPYDTFTVTLSEITATKIHLKRSAVSYSGKAICLYVRREVRDLSDDDRNKFLAAQYTLASTPQAVGKPMYGSNYYSLRELDKYHFYTTGNQDADHMSEGVGFLTQHIKFQNMFEGSMQTVDASVSLPYWDFTVDAENGNSYNSAVLSTLYGEVSVPTSASAGFTYTSDRIEDARIAESTFADTPAEANDYPQDDDLFPSENIGYAYMRAPWSMNPSKYVSRFVSTFGGTMSFPSCSDHYSLLTSYSSSLMDFLRNVEGSGVYNTKAILGGVYGCDMLDNMVSGGFVKSSTSQLQLCFELASQYKEFYRNAYWAPNLNCVADSADFRNSACGFSCDATRKADIVDYLFDALGDYLTGSASDAATATAWYDFLCDGDAQLIYLGDMQEASAASDPAFWLLQPTLERLLHAALLKGGFSDEAWATDAEAQYVCDHPKCYNTTTDSFAYAESCCYGHYSGDQLMYYDRTSQSATYVGLTNAEVFSYTDPRSANYNMSYIYDKLSWNHCTQDFNALFSC